MAREIAAERSLRSVCYFCHGADGFEVIMIAAQDPRNRFSPLRM
jgi:hypothetical protein